MKNRVKSTHMDASPSEISLKSEPRASIIDCPLMVNVMSSTNAMSRPL